MSQLHVGTSLDHTVIPSNCVVPFLFIFPCTHAQVRYPVVQAQSLWLTNLNADGNFQLPYYCRTKYTYISILKPCMLAESSIFDLLSFIFVVFLYSFHYCVKDKCLC